MKTRELSQPVKPIDTDRKASVAPAPQHHALSETEIDQISGGAGKGGVGGEFRR
jgi:hypothetical protein